jgi:hypothetical protein
MPTFCNVDSMAERNSVKITKNESMKGCARPHLVVSYDALGEGCIRIEIVLPIIAVSLDKLHRFDELCFFPWYTVRDVRGEATVKLTARVVVV